MVTKDKLNVSKKKDKLKKDKNITIINRISKILIEKCLNRSNNT
jgi:hypothetical protein